MAGVREQCAGGELRYGRIDAIEILHANLRMNAIPGSIAEMEVLDYNAFLAERRRLMAAKLRDYYFSL
jgi:hypothetical protein